MLHTKTKGLLENFFAASEWVEYFRPATLVLCTEETGSPKKQLLSGRSKVIGGMSDGIQAAQNERLQKILSHWGIASRRQAEQMILDGRVQVNRAVAVLGQKVDPISDRIFVDGVEVNPTNRPERLYVLMNKPEGVVCTCHDPHGRTTVLDLLPTELTLGSGLHPVGRLDADSTGALLLTNDGNLTFYLTHPRHHIPKTYQVWVKGYPSEEILEQWRKGIVLTDALEDGMPLRPTLPAEVRVIRRHPDHKTLLEIVLREGRNRQIRRVAEQLACPVLHLHRVAIGSIHLRSPGTLSLPNGNYRPLTEIEICFLRSQFDLTSKRERVMIEECNR